VYAGLNLGAFTDDTPASVQENLGILSSTLGIEQRRILYGYQVHGSQVHTVHRENEAIGFDRKSEQDGLVTQLPNVGLMIIVADCLPIALLAKGAVAMLHCGWRGLAAGIIANGMQALRELGVEGDIDGAIGPGAGMCCYEVGEEVHASFAAHGEEVRHARKLNLKLVARRELLAAGVDRVFDVDICTICSDRQLFYSYRRDHGRTGRQAGIAWISEPSTLT
jgi:YfiH family protein